MPVFLNAIGTVQAYNMVTVKSRVDGQIIKSQFTEGQDVKAGDPLFQIDPRPYQAALDQAEATKQKDEAQLASAQARISTVTASWSAQGYQSRQTYDQQKASVTSCRPPSKATRRRSTPRGSTSAMPTIRAPIDGRLGQRLVDVGNLVRATDAAGLVTITQLKPIFVNFTVPQDHLTQSAREPGAGAAGGAAPISEDNKTAARQGKLTLIDNAIDQTTGTIRLKATFDNADERLWPGEFVNVRLILSTRARASPPCRRRPCRRARPAATPM